jgi:hypothetical protein
VPLGRRAGVVGFQDAAVPDGDLLPQHVAEGVDGAAFGLHRHVVRLHREAGIEIKVVSTDNPPTAPGRTACPRRLGEPAVQRSNSTIRTHARRTMCRSAADVLSTSPKSLIASASDRDIGRGRHTRSTGFDPATPRSGELAISPYDLGDDGCRSADDQRTILRPVPCSGFPQ